MHQVHALAPEPMLQSTSICIKTLLASGSKATIKALVCTMSISVRLPLVSQNEQETLLFRLGCSGIALGCQMLGTLNTQFPDSVTYTS